MNIDEENIRCFRLLDEANLSELHRQRSIIGALQVFGEDDEESARVESVDAALAELR